MSGLYILKAVNIINGHVTNRAYPITISPYCTVEKFVDGIKDTIAKNDVEKYDVEIKCEDVNDDTIYNFNVEIDTHPRVRIDIAQC